MKEAEIKLYRNCKQYRKPSKKVRSFSQSGCPNLEHNPWRYMRSEQDHPLLEIYPVIKHKEDKGKLG